MTDCTGNKTSRVDLFKEGKPTPCIYLKHGQYYYVAKNKWQALGKTRKQAIQKFRELAPQTHGDSFVRKYVYIQGDLESGPIPELFLSEIMRNAKKNAKARDLSFTITMEDLKQLALADNGMCSISGIRYEYGIAEEADKAHIKRKRIWAPSIDRIKSEHGYEPWNIRLVCVAVNLAMQEFGADVLKKIAVGLSKMENSAELKRAVKSHSTDLIRKKIC